MDWDGLAERIDALDDARLQELCGKLADALRLVTPVTPATKKALAMLRTMSEADPDLLDELEGRRDELDDEFFELDAANDEEAPAIFKQARALASLCLAMKGLYGDAVAEARHAAEDEAELAAELGLDPLT